METPLIQPAILPKIDWDAEFNQIMQGSHPVQQLGHVMDSPVKLYGIENTKHIFDAVKELVATLLQVFQGGSFHWTALGNLYALVAGLTGIIKGFPLVVLELKDLDDDEMKELGSYAIAFIVDIVAEVKQGLKPQAS